MNLTEGLIKSTGADLKKKMAAGVEWFKGKIKQVGQRFGPKVVTPKSPSDMIGSMVSYVYSPKWKEILPIYDTFPLVIPIELYSDGFLGLNLHYLEIADRTRLLDALLKLRTTKSGRAYMAVSYRVLSAASKYPNYEICLKRYLSSHIKSKITIIDPNEWSIAAFLPTARFVHNPGRN